MKNKYIPFNSNIAYAVLPRDIYFNLVNFYNVGLTDNVLNSKNSPIKNGKCDLPYFSPLIYHNMTRFTFFALTLI